MGVIQDALLGLGLAGIYAMMAQGMVLIYRGSGVLNFAQAAFAALGAYIFWELHFHEGWAFAPATIVTVAATAALGVITQTVVMRPLRRRSTLARVVGTLGVLSILDGAVLLIWGDNLQIVGSSLPENRISLGGGTYVTADRLGLFAIAAAVTLLLSHVTRLTRLGLAMSGVAENEIATAALGWSPNMVATVTWAAGTGLAALAGILVIPLTGLQLDQITPLITFATAA